MPAPLCDGIFSFSHREKGEKRKNFSHNSYVSHENETIGSVKAEIDRKGIPGAYRMIVNLTGDEFG